MPPSTLRGKEGADPGAYRMNGCLPLTHGTAATAAKASADVQRQRMNTGGQIAQCLMDSTVTRHAVHRRQLCGADRHVEMRLAPLTPATMAPMPLTIILNFNNFRVERHGQPLKNLIFHSHFYRCPLHAAAQCFIVCAPSLKGLP